MTIKDARITAGLTQTDVTTVIGIPRRTIQNWERGISNPPKWAEKLVIDALLRYASEKKDT